MQSNNSTKHGPSSPQIPFSATLGQGHSHGTDRHQQTSDNEATAKNSKSPQLGDTTCERAAFDPRYNRSGSVEASRQNHLNVTGGDTSRHQEVREPRHSPTIERFLREGDKVEAYRRQEREGYPYGSPGMRQYLHDWKTMWNDASRKDN